MGRAKARKRVDRTETRQGFYIHLEDECNLNVPFLSHSTTLSLQLKSFHIPLHSTPFFRVCSPDLLMSELDSIRAPASMLCHREHRGAGVRKPVLAQCFYCAAVRRQPLWGSRSRRGPKLCQLHQSEPGHSDLYDHRQSHTHAHKSNVNSWEDRYQ